MYTVDSSSGISVNMAHWSNYIVQGLVISESHPKWEMLWQSLRWGPEPFRMFPDHTEVHKLWV